MVYRGLQASSLSANAMFVFIEVGFAELNFSDMGEPPFIVWDGLYIPNRPPFVTRGRNARPKSFGTSPALWRAEGILPVYSAASVPGFHSRGRATVSGAAASDPGIVLLRSRPDGCGGAIGQLFSRLRCPSGVLHRSAIAPPAPRTSRLVRERHAVIPEVQWNHHTTTKRLHRNRGLLLQTFPASQVQAHVSSYRPENGRWHRRAQHLLGTVQTRAGAVRGKTGIHPGHSGYGAGSSRRGAAYCRSQTPAAQGLPREAPG